VTEALRGEGAWLLNSLGRRFMAGRHPLAELAPRDIVARALHQERAAGRRTFLDARQALGRRFAGRFPTVHRACAAAGIEPATDLIPVAPAAHYHMGGVAVDLAGRSSVPGLWAVGEVACTGLHGANRLASNSLLEAAVFGRWAAQDIAAGSAAPLRQVASSPTPAAGEAPDPRALDAVRSLMDQAVGVVRDADGLARAIGGLDRLRAAGAAGPAATAGLMIACAAWQRRESRGGHFRSDYPSAGESTARSRITLAQAELVAGSCLAGEPAAMALAAAG